MARKKPLSDQVSVVTGGSSGLERQGGTCRFH
jgi:hypothetical protein